MLIKAFAMGNLIIMHKSQAITRYVAGGLWIILAIIILFTGKDGQEEKEWTRAAIIFLLGVINFTPFVGSDRSQIETADGSLRIKWVNWLRTVTIRETEIEGITIAKDGIKIFRTGKKAVKLLLYNFSNEQKEQVYDFFTRYAQQKNFV